MASPDVEHEVRLAVVMYGGSSLAIYMNGVAHELLEFVRATSEPGKADDALSGTARVYRKLARMLDDTPRSGDEPEDDEGTKALTVRFVVDIISGTSAGGINAAMLAKALIRNADLDPLKKLWVEDGALEKLINDRAGGDADSRHQGPVKSLFDSDFMYRELHHAMGALNASRGGPLVDELSLAVTGTDLGGRPIELRLEDCIAREYAHRHVFNFDYLAGDRDEFTEAYDPLLAFAARTTSSLPAAFEPTLVQHARKLAGDRGADADWGLLFRDVPDWQRDAYEQEHAFADGGYLDNKPFGHAIDRLSHAEGGVRVTRELFYLEPIPKQIDPKAKPEVPNALENSLDVVSLARYETIRADLKRIDERNVLVRRLRTLHAGVIEDAFRKDDRTWEDLPPCPDVDALIAGYGVAYGGYHRLRVSAVTADLANDVADGLDLPVDSALRTAMNLVVRAWRRTHYHRDDEQTSLRETAFLADYDLRFHRRRAVFMLDKINQLLEFEPQVVAELRNLPDQERYPRIHAMVDAANSGDRDDVPDEWKAIRPRLREAKHAAQSAANVLVHGEDRDDPLQAELEAIRPQLQGVGGLGTALLLLLRGHDDAERAEKASAFLARHGPLVEGLMKALAQRCQARAEKANDTFKAMAGAEFNDPLGSELKQLLEFYWQEFVLFDMVQFPVLHDTGFGEELSPVGVHRISATDPGFYGRAFTQKSRLRGGRYGSFGAFLDRGWRLHDIRWGRLDGADRLIGSLLGDDRALERDALIAEAHLAILREELPNETATLDAELPDNRNGIPATKEAVDRARRVLMGRIGAHEKHLALDRELVMTDLSRLARVGARLLGTIAAESAQPAASSAQAPADSAQPPAEPGSAVLHYLRSLLRFAYRMTSVAFALASVVLQAIAVWPRRSSRIGDTPGSLAASPPASTRGPADG